MIFFTDIHFKIFVHKNHSSNSFRKCMFLLFELLRFLIGWEENNNFEILYVLDVEILDLGYVRDILG